MPLLLLRGFFAGWVVNDKGEWFLRPPFLMANEPVFNGKIATFSSSDSKEKEKEKSTSKPHLKGFSTKLRGSP